jgi:hypothetical protein
MGMLFNAMGIVGLAGIGWMLLMSNIMELPPERVPSAPMVVLMFVGAVTYLFVGVELRRLQRWARYGGAALTALLCVAPVLLGGDPPDFFAVGTCLCAQLLMLTAAGRWTTVDGRAAARAVPTRPFVQVVAWGWLIVLVLLAFVPAFARMFREVGVTLGFGTAAVVDLTDLLTSYPFLQLLIPPALCATSLFLLRLDPRYERPATWGVGVAGFAALGSIIGWLVLPMIELIQKL